MASYVDTSVVAAYTIESHDNHERATAMIESARKVGQPYISVFTIVELCSAVSRNISKWGLLPPLDERVSPRVKVRSNVEYALRKLDANILPDEAATEKLEYGGVNAYRKFCETARLAPLIRMKSSDLLHIAYALQLRQAGEVDSILALDKSFKNNRDDIKSNTGLDIVYQD